MECNWRHIKHSKSNRRTTQESGLFSSSSVHLHIGLISILKAILDLFLVQFKLPVNSFLVSVDHTFVFIEVATIVSSILFHRENVKDQIRFFFL